MMGRASPGPSSLRRVGALSSLGCVGLGVRPLDVDRQAALHVGIGARICTLTSTGRIIGPERRLFRGL
jgi:hypothetical protein